MSLLNHDKTEKKKNPLDNDKQVKVERRVRRSEVVQDGKAKKEEPERQEVTVPRNLRADNHIANKVQAMVNIGVADDAKGVLSSLVDDAISAMPQGDQERIEGMVKMLEIKDYFSSQSKKMAKR